jgi:hypothetical protein
VRFDLLPGTFILRGFPLHEIPAAFGPDQDTLAKTRDAGMVFIIGAGDLAHITVHKFIISGNKLLSLQRKK